MTKVPHGKANGEEATKVNKRFKVGQRVRLSRRGLDHGLRFYNGVTEGTVDFVGNIGIDVKVDGYECPRGFFAEHWEPVMDPDLVRLSDAMGKPKPKPKRVRVRRAARKGGRR